MQRYTQEQTEQDKISVPGGFWLALCAVSGFSALLRSGQLLAELNSNITNNERGNKVRGGLADQQREKAVETYDLKVIKYAFPSFPLAQQNLQIQILQTDPQTSRH